MADEARAKNPETQLTSFFAKYEPAIAKLGKALRAKVRARLPGFFEIVYVYENQGSLVLSYSPTEHGYQGLVSIAVYPSTVKLFFGQGALLSKSDPKKLLQGGGGVRHVVMNSIADFDRAEIEALIAASLKLAKVTLDASAKGAMIIKAEEQKARARRTTTATKPTKAPKATKPAATRRTPKARS